MLEHPVYDDFWVTYDIRARHADFDTPALHVTGWYDALLTGTLANFVGLRANARTERARAGQRLIVGPWTHSGPTPESTRIGDVDYGPDAGLDFQAELERWFDYWLRGGDPSVAEDAPVRLFVMGENRWRDEREWPLARARPTPYYLHGAGAAGARRGGGRLSADPPDDETPDRYTYDPSDPVPSGEAGGYSRAPSDPTALEGREDVLVYTSDRLAADLEVTGPIELVLWVASSAPDTDFTGKLIDVFPDGSARTLTDGILRARYRNGPATVAPALEPGVPVELTIDLLATSNRFKTGHRIRLEVSSSNFPRFDRNPNTGTPVASEPMLETAEQTIFHDRTRPSRLVLPIVAIPERDPTGH
jgi:putative CocE/NonD family hydrolase